MAEREAPELARVGMSRIVPPSHRTHVEKELGELGKWRAVCRCGWVSPEYKRRTAAVRASEEHR